MNLSSHDLKKTSDRFVCLLLEGGREMTKAELQAYFQEGIVVYHELGGAMSAKLFNQALKRMLSKRRIVQVGSVYSLC